MLRQQAISAARAEYEKAGYNLSDMQMGFLARMGAIMLMLAALGMLMSIAIGFVASRTGGRIGLELRRKLFAKVVSFSESEISHFSAASLITRATNDIQLIQNVSVMLLRMILSAPIPCSRRNHHGHGHERLNGLDHRSLRSLRCSHL